jgi:hypothetical protein
MFGIVLDICLFLLFNQIFNSSNKQKPTIMPNIEQQQQTKTNYNAKHSTAATNKNQL